MNTVLPKDTSKLSRKALPQHFQLDHPSYPQSQPYLPLVFLEPELPGYSPPPIEDLGHQLYYLRK